MTTTATPAPPVAAARPNGDGARSRAQKKRMLIIVNPYATTVSDRLKNLVVYALQGRYDVEAVSTEAQNHATEIGREAHHGGYDIVVAFGGDGTLNEVANGLAGSGVPVSVLPGGSTNVVCRTLGIPNDVVDATEHLLGLADRLQAAPDRPRDRERPPVRVLGRGRHRRDRGEEGRREAAAQGPHGPVLLHLGRNVVVLHRLPAKAGADAPRRRRRERSRGSPCWPRTPTRSRTSAAARSGFRATWRSTTGRSRSQSCAARSSATWVSSSAGCSPSPSASPPPATARSITSPGSPRAGSSRSRSTRRGRLRGFPVQVDGDYIGDHTELELGVDPGAQPSLPDAGEQLPAICSASPPPLPGS